MSLKKNIDKVINWPDSEYSTAYSKQIWELYDYAMENNSPKEVIETLKRFKKDRYFHKAVEHTAEIIERMGLERGEECLIALEEFYIKFINKENFWVIEDFIYAICDFEFKKPEFHKRRENFVKKIFKDYDPDPEKNYSKEDRIKDFREHIEEYIEDQELDFELE